MRVILAFIGDALEAVLLRAHFESLGCQVDWRPLGKPSDLFTAFDADADVAIISCHGDAGGIVFPPLSERIDTIKLVQNCMPASMLTGFSRPLPQIVISTGCALGTKEFAAAFHQAGAELYLAPPDYPDGCAVPTLLALTAYLVTQRKFGWVDAIAAANSHVEAQDRFSVFSR